MEHKHQEQNYTCPMHPEIVQDKPGNCPKCGMSLVPLKTGTEVQNPLHQHQHEDTKPLMSHAGNDHHAMMIDDFKKRFYVVLALTIPVMLLSKMIQHWLNIHISFPGLSLIHI